ncbi:MAG TPA: CHAT domain-containing protein, partial [Flavitalea sp.]|nr:CHAT domain-containing protein [Flavitalea sp.]
IAFIALRYDTSHLLIEKYQLNQVLSTRSVVFRREELKKPLSAAVWGDIDYDLRDTNNGQETVPTTRGLNEMSTTESIFNLYTNDTRGYRKAGWPSLSNSKKEIALIKKTIAKSASSVSDVSGRSATEEAFKALNGKSPQLLHLATHGFFLSVKENSLKDDGMDNGFTMQQNPMFRSGIVLAGGNHAWTGGKIPENSEDGILTAYEIAQLDLSNTELVVLSACETALGETKYANEGVFGLQRAFKLAGVKKMIVSLWQVPDDATVELMTLFYQNWLDGQTIREALHKSQMQMKKKYPPFFWAAFVVVE